MYASINIENGEEAIHVYIVALSITEEV